MERSIKMIRRVGGIMGELGRGIRSFTDDPDEPVSVDILSVGPQFQELDRRWLDDDTRKPPFFRFEPCIGVMH